MSKPSQARRLEIFTGAGSRRQWLPEIKAQIVAESYGAGETVSGVARRHGLTVQQLFAWRRAAKRAVVASPAFVPVVVSGQERPAQRTAAEIEVEIGGAKVLVRSGADTATLRLVLAALRGL